VRPLFVIAAAAVSSSLLAPAAARAAEPDAQPDVEEPPPDHPGEQKKCSDEYCGDPEGNLSPEMVREVYGTPEEDRGAEEGGASSEEDAASESSTPSPSSVVAFDEAPAEPAPEPMSEGRMLVSLYYSGFQWGLSPGVLFSGGKAGFFLGVRFGYGFDTGSVIAVPGVSLSGYFIDPNVYVGMPTIKLVLPIDRFAPFVTGGAGAGHVTEPQATGVALMGGGGFMLHFTGIAFGAEVSYQTITSTEFAGWSVGPLLALGF